MHCWFCKLPTILSNKNIMIMSSFAFIGVAIVATLSVSAQNFNPAGGSALSNGIIGQLYPGQVLNFTVPSTANINTAILGDPLTVPGVPIPIPNPNVDIAADVTDVTWTVEGLPDGLTATCDVNPCTYLATTSGTISISGTPTEAGLFTIDITSITNGSATLPAPISQTIALENQPEVLDELGYTLLISSPGPCVPPNVLFAGLNASYTVSDNPVTLVGAPSGGMFFGDGIVIDQFDPSVAGVGTHGITYVYENQSGCIGAYSLCTSVGLAVGVDGEQSIGYGSNFILHPNPTQDHILLSSNSVDGALKYTIYDLSGKIILMDWLEVYGAFEELIDLRSLEKGAYLIELKTSTTTGTQKFIVQ